MKTRKRDAGDQQLIEQEVSENYLYPLELVAQVAATLAVNRSINSAASDAILLLKACERELRPVAQSPAKFDVKKLLAEAREDLHAGSFEREIIRLTKEKNLQRALLKIRSFFRYEIERERTPSLESLSQQFGFAAKEMRLRTLDERVEMQIAQYQETGIGGLGLANFEERYMTWHHQVYRKDVAATNRANGSKGGWKKGKPRGVQKSILRKTLENSLDK